MAYTCTYNYFSKKRATLQSFPGTQSELFILHLGAQQRNRVYIYLTLGQWMIPNKDCSSLKEYSQNMDTYNQKANGHMVFPDVKWYVEKNEATITATSTCRMSLTGSHGHRSRLQREKELRSWSITMTIALVPSTIVIWKQRVYIILMYSKLHFLPYRKHKSCLIHHQEC